MTVSAIETELSSKSPDLFSQDDMDQSLLEVTIQSEKAVQQPTTPSNQDTKQQLVTDTKQQQATSDTKQQLATDTNKIEDNRPANPRMSLFDAMTKMESGELQNPATSNTLLGNQRRHSLLNDGSPSMEHENETPSKHSKSISRKITDYFTKKPI